VLDKGLGRGERGLFFRLLSMLWSLGRLLLCLGLSLPGGVLFSPVIVLIRRLSERERLRCLRESKVKLEARDIVASYKIILGAALLPAYSILCSVLLYLILQRRQIIKGGYIAISACILFWLVYAPIAVRSFDGVLNHFKVFRSKLATLFNPGSYDTLKRLREALKT
jgi:glycerol-3-phosphate O-acyltransferase/dihydroxyacetone phosphate acyltransferase